MGNSGSLGAVYAGRFIAGLGVGQTVVVAPVYLAEIVSAISKPFHTWVKLINSSSRLQRPFVVFALVSLPASFISVRF